MKTIKLEIPEGYEIDKEKSTFENIILKKIEKKRPLSVKEIKGRNWYISVFGQVKEGKGVFKGEDINLSSKERAEAFLALMQLVELRDAWNEASGEEWCHTGLNHTIFNIGGAIKTDHKFRRCDVLYFKDNLLRDQFLETFRDLIETAKELI